MLADRIDRDGQGIGMAVALVDVMGTRFVSHGHGSVGGAAVDETSVFEIGSITKVFTNLLLARMVLAGQMALDAPIGDYLPAGISIPAYAGRAITPFDLATHSSSLPRLPENLAPADAANPYADYGSELLFAFLADYVLPRPIGTEFEYSNLGSGLLAQAITWVAGLDYENLLRRDILDPLDMTDTGLTPGAALQARLASGHNAAHRPTRGWDFDALAGAGAIRSTAADMARFVAAASGAVASPLDAAFALMLERIRVNGEVAMGLGWLLEERPDGDIAWHNGGTGGFRSFAGVDRSNKCGVVVLSNFANAAGVDDIGLHLLDRDLPLAEQPRRRTAIALNPALLERYIGDYAIVPEFVLSVTVENGQVFVQATGQERLPVHPESETAFFYIDVDAQLSFELGSEGPSTRLVLHQNGQDMPAVRL